MNLNFKMLKWFVIVMVTLSALTGCYVSYHDRDDYHHGWFYRYNDRDDWHHRH